MARRSRSRAERDTTDIASPEFDRLLRPISPTVPVSVRQIVSDDLPLVRREVEDLRTFDPTVRTSTARSVTGVPARVNVVPVRSVVYSSGSVAPPSVAEERFRFADNRNVMVCVRRKERREVLFAERRTRAGAGARRKRNFWSDIGC